MHVGPLWQRYEKPSVCAHESDLTKRPASFFKYRSMDAASQAWVERTILQDEVYFAPASSFNDPFDLRPSLVLDATPEEHRQRFINSSLKFEPHLSADEREASADQAMTSMTPERIQETTTLIQALHAEMLTTNRGVFCVSTKRDDILMWSHYADHHRGICLEFDGNGMFMAHAQAVQYSDERVPINAYRDDPDMMLAKAMLTKSSHWAYETEWRLLSYQRGPGVVKIRPENLIGVVIGAIASAETVAKVHEWCGARSRPLRIHRASVSSTKFSLEIRP